MSQIRIQANASGTGTFTIAPPPSDNTPVITLPNETTTVAGTDLTQTMLNQTLGSGLVMGVSAITSIPQVATTSGTSVVLATGIPSWVRNVTVAFSSLSAGSSAIIIQFGTGGTPTWTTTGYASSSDNYSSAAGPIANATNGFRIGSTSLAGSLISCLYTFASLGNNEWVGQLNGATTGSIVVGGGIVTLADTLTAIRFTTSNGTDVFDSGTASVIYE